MLVMVDPVTLAWINEERRHGRVIHGWLLSVHIDNHM